MTSKMKKNLKILKDEDDPRNTDDLKNEDDPKIEDNLENKMAQK